MNEKRVVCIIAGAVELVSFLGLHFSHTLTGRLASYALMAGGGVIAIQALPLGSLKKYKALPIVRGARNATSSFFVKQEPPPPWPEFADAIKSGFPNQAPVLDSSSKNDEPSSSNEGVLKPLSRAEMTLGGPAPAISSPVPVVESRLAQEVSAVPRFLMDVEDSLSIAGLKIRSRFFYLGVFPENPYSIDPALEIDFSKRSGNRPFESGRSYSYAELSPEERGDLLLWLSAEGRPDEASQSSLGFFLGGLAYCLLLEKSKFSADTLRGIEARIREIAFSPSIDTTGFSSRISRLLVAIFAKETHVLYEPEEARPPTDEEMLLNPEILRFRLGTVVRKQFLLGGAWALSWVRTSRSFTLKTPALRCAKLFDQLFSTEVDAYETRQRFDFIAESDAIGIHISGDDVQKSPLFLQIKSTPDVVNTSTVQSILQDICDRVSESLSEYSRAIASLGEGELSIEALHKLPLNVAREPYLSSFILKTTANMDGAHPVKIFDSNWIFNQLGVRQRSGKAGMGRDSLDLLSRAFSAHGFGITPGSIPDVPMPLIDGCFVIFKASENADLIDGLIVSAVLHAMFIAIGQADSSLVIQNAKALESDVGIFGPDIIQVNEFKALLMWACANIHNLSSRISNLKQLCADDREKAAELVAKIVLVLIKDEQKTGNSLSSLYSSLGLSTDLVYHHMMPGRAVAGGFTLDPDAVKRLAEESSKASALLSASLEKTQSANTGHPPASDIAQREPSNLATPAQPHHSDMTELDTSTSHKSSNESAPSLIEEEEEDEEEMFLPATFNVAQGGAENAGWADDSLWTSEEPAEDIPQQEGGGAFDLSDELGHFARYLLTATSWELAVLHERFGDDFDLDDALSRLDELCFAQFADSLYLALSEATVEIDPAISEQFAALYNLSPLESDALNAKPEPISPEVPQGPLSKSNAPGPKLSGPVLAFVHALAEEGKTEWEKGKLDALAGQWGLMTMGVLEHLNETCFDTFSQELVDDMTADGVVFDLSILRSLIEIAASTSEQSV